jgi:3-hydroxy-9,10-secoandrosta-1,3,5(10)-triene-9,17-dione monooxygenase
MQLLERPSIEELYRRVEALLPALRERAAECTALGRLPDATARDFEAAGLFRILQPASHGGFEYSPKVLWDIVVRLASACPSSAWTLSVVGIHNWEVGLMSPRVADDIWGDDQTVRISSSYEPVTKAIAVDGGYRVSGRWRFSSGCDLATWAVVGAMVENPVSGELQHYAMFVEPGAYHVVPDSWHVLGMRGTGSKDFIVENAFVPEYRAHPMGDQYVLDGIASGRIHSDAYKYPFRATVSYCLSSVALGIADGALEDFRSTWAARIAAKGDEELRRNSRIKQRYAEAFASIDAAHLRFDRDWAEMDAYIARGETIPMLRRAAYIWNSSYNANSLAEAVTTLFRGSGARAIHDGDSMQGFMRDIFVLPNHTLLKEDQRGDDLGLIAFGGTVAL